MKIEIKDNEVRISDEGIKFLRLKTEILKRVDNAYSVGKELIVVPIAAAISILDLLESEQLENTDLGNLSRKFESHSIARLEALEKIENEDIKDIFPKWVEILDTAQATAVSAMIVPDLLGLCLFDEQGSGKTVMTIASFDILLQAKNIDGIIIACPKSMIGEWQKDIQKFTGNTYKIVQANGDKAQKYSSAFTNFDILITNYEGIDVMLVTLLAQTENRRILLIIDESFYVKNEETVRSQKLGLLRAKCKRCFVLCGTPAPNSAHDLINQFDLADLGFTFGSFKKSKNPAKDWEKISNLVESRGIFIRRLKTDILNNVPDKNFHVVRIELKGKQALLYEKARTELELHLKTLNNQNFKKHLAFYFQRRTALLQICSCPSILDPTLSEIPAKYIELDALLTKLIKLNRKVIVWSFFKRSLDEMFIRYKQYNPVRVDGGVSTEDRKGAVISFQEDPEVMLFLGNPAAAGAGITLHASYDAVYISYSNQAAHYLQSLDRIHRRGQISDHVNYYLLVCKNTIEETEVVRLRGKELNQHDLLGDHIPWPTSLDEALSELSTHV